MRTPTPQSDDIKIVMFLCFRGRIGVQAATLHILTQKFI